MARNGNADGAETNETAETTEPAMTTVTTEPAMTTVTTETTMTTDDNSANENEQGNIKEDIKAIKKDLRAFMEDRKGKNARRMEMTRRKESKSEARGQESGRNKQNIDKVTRRSNGSAKEWSSNAGNIN